MNDTEEIFSKMRSYTTHGYDMLQIVDCAALSRWHVHVTYVGELHKVHFRSAVGDPGNCASTTVPG
jgi:hypothetical protein